MFFLPLVLLAFIILTVLPLPFSLVKIISPTRAANLSQAFQIGQLENIVNTLSYYAPASQFYAVYGFVACVLLVLVAKYILRPLVKRGEDYYD